MISQLNKLACYLYNTDTVSKLGQFAMPMKLARACDSCVYYVRQTHAIDQKILNPLSKTVLNKCSFIWNT